MTAADAATDSVPKRALERRAHDPDAPDLVPPIAAGHNDPVVRELVKVLTRLYERRGSLGHALLNHLGDLLFPAVPELLRRHPQHREDCKLLKGRPNKRAGLCDCPPAGPELPRRRSDGTEAIIRVLLVLASCCDWVTMRILDPGGGYLSVWRIAELANLPVLLVPPRDGEDPRRRRHRMDTTERVLRILRTARIIAYTEQHREELLDGRHTSTGPAIRKLSVSFFKKFGGELARTFIWRRGKLIEKAEERAAKAFKAGVGTDLAVSSALRKLETASAPAAPSIPALTNQLIGSPPPAGPTTASTDRWTPVPFELTDEIHAENPHWSVGEINAEARRRMRAPPSSSSREPSSEN
jgi:hypothetical protein